MTRDIQLDETEFAGAQKIRHIDVDVTDYSNGEGVPLSAPDMGMNRIQHLHVNSVSDSPIYAKHVRDESAVYLYDNEGEVAEGTEDTLRVMAIGR